MRRPLIVFAVTLASVTVLAPVAFAQSSPPKPVAARKALQSYDRLSPSSQRLARALFDAQVGEPRLTLDEIATLRLAGTTWAEIFAEFLSRDLVTEQELSQLMRQHKSDLARAGRSSD
jgi:hypothetical protein